MSKKSPEIYDKYRVEATSVNDLDGCATTEATGLIPSLPTSKAEIDSYEAILPFSPECYVQKTSGKGKQKTP